MNSTKFICFLNQKTPHANSKFCKYAWQSLWFKLKVVWWKCCMHKRCPMWIFLFNVLVYVWMVSSAATDATLKCSSDNECMDVCDFIMEQTSCSHPNWSNLHVKEYHWLGEQAVSPHCWSPLAGYEVKSVTLSMLISVFTELHAFVSHVCLTWLPFSPSRPAFCLLLRWNLNWRVTFVTHWRWSKCSCFEGDFQGEVRHCVRRLTWAW